ncbi:MAG: hypothetical protein HY718_17630 [Planctomycetes bacterium]|nr:hypothetical protein [Planctomycetota bacterium]
MPLRFLGALAIVIVISLIISRRNKKVREAAWSGVVTGVKHQRASVARDEDRLDNDWVTVGYRTDEGRDASMRLRMRVVRQFFDGRIEPGDRLVKKSGAYLPIREGIAQS